MAEAILDRPSKKKVTEPRRVSIETYYELEEKSLTKNEYHNGIILKMAGGTLDHDSLTLKSGALLLFFVEDNNLNYRVNSSDLKIRIEDYDKIVYPDALVISGKAQFYNNRKDTITNPLVIVEVLSDSTKKFDKTTKFDMYRSLDSFKEYVLIHQDRKHVVVYSKQEDGSWILRDYKGDDTAILYHLENCPLPLKRLYRGINL